MAETGCTSAMLNKIISLGSGDIENGSSNVYISVADRSASLIETPADQMIDGGHYNDEVVDIERWADSLEMILEDIPTYMCKPGHPGRISRIPENICEVDRKAYEPCFMSIGPYHHGKPQVQHMEKRKKVVLKCFLQQKPELSLKDCLKEIKSMEQEARSFYADIEMNSENFVCMLLLDSFYIVTSLCGASQSKESIIHINPTTSSRVDIDDMDGSVTEINDGMRYNETNNSTLIIETVNQPDNEKSRSQPTWFWTLFMHDIFLLENQLPLFILEKTYNLAYGGSKTQLIDILKDVLGDLLSNYTKLDDDILISPTEEVQHLLHLCHMFFRPALRHETTTYEPTHSSQMFRLGSVIQLYEAGVRFMARSDLTKHSLIDITFSNSGKIVMPCLYVDDNINSILRNLIALEQMKYPSMGLNVSSYAVLLLHLITTAEDVELLRRKGIIQHHLASDKEMMYLINRLSVGLAFDYLEDSYSLKPVFQELQRYTEQRVPRWRAWLKHKYFSNPWTTISLMAASLLLLLSAVETYYTVYSYYHPL